MAISLNGIEFTLVELIVWLIVGAIIGALIFVLFINNVDCTLKPGGRSGMKMNCRELGEP